MLKDSFAGIQATARNGGGKKVFPFPRQNAVTTLSAFCLGFGTCFVVTAIFYVFFSKTKQNFTLKLYHKIKQTSKSSFFILTHFFPKM
jgi:hypothetical protein